MIAIRDFVRLLLYLVAIIYATTYINQTHFGRKGFRARDDLQFLTSMYRNEQYPNEEVKFVAVTVIAMFVISWCISKILDTVQTVGQFIFLIAPLTLVIMYYLDLITVDKSGVKYHHDRLKRDMAKLLRDYPSAAEIGSFLSKYIRKALFATGDFFYAVGEYF